MKAALTPPIGILGFGVEGASTLRYLQRNGIRNIVIMDRGAVTLPPDLSPGVSVKVFSGDSYLDGLRDCVTVVRSAGVNPLLPEILKFRENGGLLTSQTEIFASSA